MTTDAERDAMRREERAEHRDDMRRVWSALEGVRAEIAGIRATGADRAEIERLRADLHQTREAFADHRGRVWGFAAAAGLVAGILGSFAKGLAIKVFGP